MKKELFLTPQDDLQKALDSAPNDAFVHLASGAYRQKLVIRTPGLTIIGQGAENTQIVFDDYAQKLGYLAGIQGFKREKAVYCGGAFPKEMLIFSGLNSNEVDTFLAEYKKTGLSPIDLKAIVTQHNVFWTPETLFRELMKEHFAFH